MAQGEILAELTLRGDKQVTTALDEVGDEMDNASADAVLFAGSLGQLADELSDVVAPATATSNRLDEVGDEAAQAGRKSAMAAGGVATLRASLFPVGVGASVATNRLVLLAGALTAVGIAAAPVAAGLLGVAGGFAAVAGVMAGGLLAGAAHNMDELKSALKGAKKEVAAATKPIGDLFGPVLLKGVNAIGELVRRIVDAVGNLKPFRDALLELGSVAMTAIPQAAGAFADLAREMLPLFVKGMKLIMNGLAPAFNYLAAAAGRLQQGYRDVIGPARQFLTANRDTFGALGSLIDQFQRFAKLVVVAGLRLGTVLGPAFAPVIDGAARAFKQFNNFAAALLGVGDASNRAAAIFRQKLGQLAGIARKAMAGVRKAITIGASTAEAAIAGDWGAVTYQFKHISSEAVRLAKQEFGKLKAQLPKPVRQAGNKAVTALQNALGPLKQTATTQLKKVEGVWNRHGGKVKDAVRDAFTFVKTHPDKVLTTLASTVVPGPLGLVVTAFKNNLNNIKKEVRLAFNAVKKTVRTVMGVVKRQIITPMQTAGTRSNKILGQLKTEFKQTFGLINDIATRVLGLLNKHFGETFRNILATFRQHISGGDGLVANARTAFNTLWTTIIKPILDTIQAGWQLFGDDLIRILDGVLGTISTIVSIAFDGLLTTINVILDLISGDWEGAWNSIAGFLERTWNKIVSWVKGSGKKLFTGALDVVIKAIKGVFDALWKWLIGSSFIPDLFNAVADWITGTGVGLFEDAFNAVKEGVLGVFDKLKDGVEDTISGLVSGVKDTINDAVSWIQDTFNAAIPDKLNFNVGFDIPKVKIGGGSVGGVNIPSATIGGGRYAINESLDLPQLAEGGIATRPTLAEIGEGSEPEAVLPLSKLDRMLDSDGSGDTTHVTIEKGAIVVEEADDGRRVAAETKRELDRLLGNAH
ncbi:phage tail protein [Halomarina rubra]|uniref:Phage-related protein n=1 Tax=Halomarina rubra TaxID=2071873 RepID=A0ABD6B1C5_9EURY|nr:hypothetical protein [Halomarina rubra]